MTLCLNGFLLQKGVAEYTLRNSIREYYSQTLIAKPDQGRLYEVTMPRIHETTFCGMATSHALRTGALSIEPVLTVSH